MAAEIKDSNLNIRIALHHLLHGCSVTPQLVQSHVEKRKLWREWTWWEHNNVQVDELSTQTLDVAEAGGLQAVAHLEIPLSPGHILLSGQLVTLLSCSHICNLLLAKFARKWLTRCFS